jgi:uncharacterized protein YacL
LVQLKAFEKKNEEDEPNYEKSLNITYKIHKRRQCQNMKVDKTVVKETAYVIIGTVVLDILMLVVYSLIESLRPDMIYGAVFGSVAAILNFFFMAYTLQRAVEMNGEDVGSSEEDKNKEEKAEKVKLKVKASYTVRTMVYLLSLVAALITGWFDVYTLLIPSLFPTIVARIRMFYLNKYGE